MQVKWSAASRHELASAVEQCRRMFGNRVAERFLQHIAEEESRLANYPRLGKLEPLLVHETLNYRSLVVHKHYKIVYFIQGDIIRIADLWDTRREPAALVRHIK